MNALMIRMYDEYTFSINIVYDFTGKNWSQVGLEPVSVAIHASALTYKTTGSTNSQSGLLADKI